MKKLLLLLCLALFPSALQAQTLNCSGGCGGNQKAIGATKNLADASAAQSFTGCGFMPTAVIVIASVNSTDRGSWSVATKVGSNVVKGMSTPNGSTAFFASVGSNIIFIQDDAGANSQSASLTSFDADGITIAWTKTGAPSGNIDIGIMCIK